MVAAEKALIRAGVLDDAARAAYASAYRPDRETGGGLGSMDTAMAGAQLFEVVVAGAVVARYALRLDRHENGVEMVVVAAAGGVSGVDLTASVVPTIETQGKGAGADRVTLRTRRAGLVRKLKKQGWVLDAYCMGKTIK
ncbi:hypothetical protein [Janthinobacterium sp.]|uniref:hypothetical protein n=1 Tax=Janthinobacterium sp. TaxID=1871054 RepID=UPI002623C6A0|nr:hypothetical protein [Janthinobacterium sp.]